MILDAITWAAVAAALAAEDSRWLRVAQREHYEPGRATAMAGLWSRVKPENQLLLAAAALCIAAGLWAEPVTLLGLAAIAAWPLGLPVRGRSARFGWTDRMKRLTGVTVGLQLVLAAAAGLLGGPYAAAVVALLAVPTVDLAMAIMRPVEKKLAQRWVVEAQDKLRRLRPTVVAITGSYGKTSTKLYVNQLLSRSHAAVASPASFNNLGPVPHRQRPARARHRGLRRRDGHLRPRRDPRALPRLSPDDRRHHHDRRGPPRADEEPRDHRPRQVRDHRGRRDLGPQRRRARAG